MSALQPFEQLPFDELPETPPKPHAYFEAEARMLRVRTGHFGPVTTHLRVYGEGPPLLLVHGLMTSSYSWRYVLEPLGEHFTVYAPDLPGAGRSQKVLGVDYGPRHLARWIAALQLEVGIYGCPVIGNSLGGYLAMWLALEQPEAMSRLVNLHSPGVPEFRLRFVNTALSVPGTRRLVAWMARRHPEKWCHENVHYYDESLKSLEEAREYARALSTTAGARTFAHWLGDTLDPAEMGEFVSRLELRADRREGFPMPLMLMYAADDPMVPPDVGRRLAELIPDADLVWLDEASHFAHVDAPQAFLPPVLDFLDKK